MNRTETRILAAAIFAGLGGVGITLAITQHNDTGGVIIIVGGVISYVINTVGNSKDEKRKAEENSRTREARERAYRKDDSQDKN